MADFASASTGSSGASPPGTSKTPWWCLPYPTKRKPSSFSFTPTTATQTLAVTGTTASAVTGRSRSLRRPSPLSPSRGQTPRPTYATVANS